MKKRILIFLLVCFWFLMGVFAGNEEIKRALPRLSQSEHQELLDGKIVDGKTIDGGQILHYFVEGTEAAKQASLAQQADTGFSIAAVSYIPYGPKLKAMDIQSRQLAIFNAIRAISTQEGLTYISWRAGNKPKLLMEKSAYMENEKDLNKLLPDPVATELPLSVQSYVFQRDTSFGGNRYLHTYKNSEKEIFVEIKNISSMKVFGIFTAVPKDQLTINMSTYQLEDGLLLTALTTIADRKPEVSVLGITVDLPSAFKRRITALQNWFVDQLNHIETR